MQRGKVSGYVIDETAGVGLNLGCWQERRSVVVAVAEYTV